MCLFMFNLDPLRGWMLVDNNVKAAGIMVFSLVAFWLTTLGARFTSLEVVVARIELFILILDGLSGKLALRLHGP